MEIKFTDFSFDAYFTFSVSLVSAKTNASKITDKLESAGESAYYCEKFLP